MKQWIKVKKKDIFLAVAILGVSLGICLWQHINAKAGILAIVFYGNHMSKEVSLNTNCVYHFESNGMTVHTKVLNGKIAFIESLCPDHICESFGWLSEQGDIAVCLPAGVVLEIK